MLERREAIVQALQPVVPDGVLTDALEKARTLWPCELGRLPMDARHQDILRAHWRALQPEFRIE